MICRPDVIAPLTPSLTPLAGRGRDPRRGRVRGNRGTGT